MSTLLSLAPKRHHPRVEAPAAKSATLGKILLAEDDDDLRQVLAHRIRQQGHHVDVAANGSEAIAALERETYDVVVTDLWMPGADGLTVLRETHNRAPETLVIVTTANATLETALQALRSGAGDYVQKSPSFVDLLDRVNRAVELRLELRGWQALRRQLNVLDSSTFLLGKSAAVERLRRLIERVAPTDTTVLITGESGVGKDVAARALHALSHRREKPFLAVNCGAIAENLLESHLFGHAKGSFTGADVAYEGVFRAAAGGTVFLDEIGDLPLHLQVKLLRAIEQNEILPVGTSKPVTVDVRWIASTNRDLKQDIAAGRYREDLYYRLKVVTLEIPPLRERREDIPPLVERYLRTRNAALGRAYKGVTNDAMSALMSAPWPGNVREMQHVLEYSMVLGTGDWIEAGDLPAGVRPDESVVPTESSDDLADAVRRFERLHIESVLRQVRNDRRSAAARLGIHLATLYRKLQDLGITAVD
jgi:DNA-binding NtrC family response regulator